MLEKCIRVFERLGSGSNCVVNKCNILYGDTWVNSVYKTLYIPVPLIAEDIRSDFIEIRRSIVESNVSVPDLYFCGISDFVENRNDKVDSNGLYLIIIESYEGLSIKDLIKSKILGTSGNTWLFKKCESFINTFPENIPLDVNPGNITLSNNEKLRFIDFIPSFPWKYVNHKEKEADFIKVFPTLTVTLSDKDNRDRYYCREKRIEKFNYHIRKLLAE